MTQSLISISILMVLICFINGCDVNNKQPENKLDKINDTLIITKSSKTIDTLVAYDKTLENYVRAYKDTTRLDTSFHYMGKILKISFCHYCTFDSLLIIPVKYVENYGIKSFKTHNFQSSLKISADNRKVIDTIITKDFFIGVIFDEEKKYGALLYPVISIGQKGIKIDYSVSIPLSDVGA